MNAVAVAAYESGDNQKAAGILIEALRLMSAMLTNATNLMSNEHNTQHEYEQHNKFPMRMDSTSYRSKLQLECSNDEPNMNLYSEYSVHPEPKCTMSHDPNLTQKSATNHDIYSGAFLLGIGMSLESTDATAALLYNLALVVHHEGIKIHQAFALQKALKLYQQALSFLDTNKGIQKSPVICVLLSAILTNIAQIRNELLLSSPSDNETTVNRLLDLVLYMEYTCVINSSDIEFFKAIIIFLSLTSLSIAPAA